MKLEWVPMAERKPPKDAEVWIVDNHDGVRSVAIAVYNGSLFDRDTFDGPGYSVYYDVSHWAPYEEPELP